MRFKNDRIWCLRSNEINVSDDIVRACKKNYLPSYKRTAGKIRGNLQ